MELTLMMTQACNLLFLFVASFLLSDGQPPDVPGRFLNRPRLARRRPYTTSHTKANHRADWPHYRGPLLSHVWRRSSIGTAWSAHTSDENVSYADYNRNPAPPRCLDNNAPNNTSSCHFQRGYTDAYPSHGPYGHLEHSAHNTYRTSLARGRLMVFSSAKMSFNFSSTWSKY